VVVFNDQVPSLATATDVEKQFGAVSVTSHSRIRDEDNELPVSLESGRYDNMSPNPPICESTTGAGAVGAFTVTFMVDDPHDDGGVAGAQVPPMVLQTT
jgi:hypothetical protein